MPDMVLKSIDVGPMRSVRDSFTGPYIVTMPPVLTDFSKFDFKGKNIILTVVLSFLVLPLESILLSLFFIVNKLGWIDSYLALIIPFIVKCFDVYLFRQFFLDIPDDLIEAAEIDGAGPFKIFMQVVMPISKPVFATVFILDYVAYWSDFMWPLLVITDADGSADHCFPANDYPVSVFAEVLCSGNFNQWNQGMM